jgi:hypothetical protein
MSILSDWASRHSVGPIAMAELFGLMGYTPETPVELEGKNEAFTQSAVRISSAHKGFLLGRNNVGALKDERGIPVRYGWLNDSVQLNTQVKTGDLLGYQSGWFRDYETCDPVKIAVFSMLECKKAGWKHRATDKHEIAQLRAINMVLAAGGIAAFTTGSLPQGVRFPALTNGAPQL